MREREELHVLGERRRSRYLDRERRRCCEREREEFQVLGEKGEVQVLGEGGGVRLFSRRERFG